MPVAVITVFAAILRFAFLGQQSYWYDEAATVRLLHRSFHGLVAAIQGESTPPLYYALALAWSKVFGTGEVGLRALSALAGTATVPVTYWAGRVLVSRSAGLMAAALVACSPLLVWYSQEARAYSLFVFLTSLSVLTFAQVLQRPGKGRLAGWALVSCLAVATHYFAVFLVGAEAVWLVVTRRSRVTALAIAAVVGASASFLPLAVVQERSGTTAFIARLPLAGRIRESLRQFATGEYAPPHGVGIVVLIGVLAVGLAALGWPEPKGRVGGLLAFGLGGTAILAPLAFSLTGLDRFYYRNLVGAFVPLAIGIAAGLSSSRLGRFGLTAVAVLCVLEFAAVVIVHRRPGLQRDDWRLATRALGPTNRARAIIVTPSYNEAVVKLYQPVVRTMPVDGVAVSEIVLLDVSQSPHSFQPPTGFKQVELVRLQHIVLARYRATKRHTVTALELAKRADVSIEYVVLEPAVR